MRLDDPGDEVYNYLVMTGALRDVRWTPNPVLSSMDRNSDA